MILTLVYTTHNNPTLTYRSVLIGNDVTFEPVAYPGILFRGGGSTSSVEDRENGDLGAVAP